MKLFETSDSNTYKLITSEFAKTKELINTFGEFETTKLKGMNRKEMATISFELSKAINKIKTIESNFSTKISNNLNAIKQVVTEEWYLLLQ